MKKNEFREILNRYQFDNLIEELDDIEKDLTLKVGFLGEFSSGKSSLINNLIGQKILPVMAEPTSKTIVEIEGADIEKPEYYKYVGMDMESISAMEFSDICTTTGEHVAYLKLPEGEFLKKGYLIVDTPGISSLDQSDEDITFGYLPELDAVVLCQDIQFGGLNGSIQNFMLKPEVKPMLNNFIFAVTKSDTKNDPEKIRKHVVSQLNELNNKHNLGLNNIDKRVVLVSDTKESNEFIRVFDELIFKQKQKLQIQRREKEYLKVAQKTLELLKEQKQNATLDLDDIKKEELEIENDIETLKKNEKILKEKFDRFEEKLQGDIRSILRTRSSEFSQAKDEEELLQQISIIEQGVIEKANMRASKYIGDAGLDTIDSAMMVNMREQITAVLTGSNIAKQIGSFLLFAVIIPGATAAANAAEGASGLVVREAAKKGAKSVAKNTAKQTVKEVTKKAVVTTVLKNVLDILDKINPIEIAGNIIQAKMIESKFQDNIIPIATNLAFAIRNDLEEQLEYLFEKNREEMQNKKALSKTLYEKKRKKGQEFANYLNQVSTDIRNLIRYVG